MRRYLRSWALCCLCSFLHKAQALSHTEPDAPVDAVCDSSADADAVELSAHTVEAATDADPDIIGVMQIRLHGAEDPPWRELNIWRGRTPRELLQAFYAANGVVGEREAGDDAKLLRMVRQIQFNADKPKIIDIFMYNGEPLLELRLKLLYDVVDEFICVEARDVHSGARDKQGLYVEQYAAMLEPYRDKLTILIIEDFPTPDAGTVEALQARWSHILPESAQAWYRENYHRNYAADYVRSKYVQNDVPFVPLVCDLDELPDPAIVGVFGDSFATYEKLSTAHHLIMEHFFYNFRWRYTQPFSNAYAVNEQGFQDMHGDLNRMRSIPDPGFRGGGWHGSYFLSVGGIIRKLQSNAHREFSTEQFVDPLMIRRCLRSGCNILQQEPVWVLHEHNVSALPLPLQEFHRNLVFLQEHCG